MNYRWLKMATDFVVPCLLRTEACVSPFEPGLACDCSDQSGMVDLRHCQSMPSIGGNCKLLPVSWVSDYTLIRQTAWRVSETTWWERRVQLISASSHSEEDPGMWVKPSLIIYSAGVWKSSMVLVFAPFTRCASTQLTFSVPDPQFLPHVVTAFRPPGIHFSKASALMSYMNRGHVASFPFMGRERESGSNPHLNSKSQLHFSLSLVTPILNVSEILWV